MANDDSDFLMLSELKHFQFYRRRWALVHIGSGRKITGVCDMVKLYKDEDGVPIQGRSGRWRLYPVEYKLGQPDSQGADALQLCAQAMCLEERFVTDIQEAALYYGKIKRRQRIPLTEELWQKVRDSVAEMHQLRAKGYTPKAKREKSAKAVPLWKSANPN